MSPSKSLHNRELEISPGKKILSEIVSVSTNVDGAIDKAVRLALAKQQETFNTSILAAVTKAMDSVVVPHLVNLKVQIKQANKAVHNVMGAVEYKQSRG